MYVLTIFQDEPVYVGRFGTRSESLHFARAHCSDFMLCAERELPHGAVLVDPALLACVCA